MRTPRLVAVASLAMIVAAIAAAVSCGTSEPTKRSLPAAAAPAGERADVLASRLHRAHLAGTTTPLPCSACHDLNASEFVAPDRARCLTCHPDRATAIHADKLVCGQCHQFTASPAEPGESRPAVDCLSCHAEAQGETHAVGAHSKVDCQRCHQPHGEPALAIADCLTCHEDHEQNHGKPGQTTIERCSDCHPPHTRSIEAVARCATCHKDRIRNLRGHDRCEVCHAGDRSSAPKQPKACTECHRANAALSSSKVAEHRRCESCHAPHDPAGTARQSCRRCHDKLEPRHPGAGPLGRCLGCHPAHPKGAASIARACSSCHRDAKTDTGFHAAGKSACRDCHSSHQFKPPACASCHSSQKSLVAQGHARCEQCHRDAHRATAPTAACGTCHQAQRASAPSGHRDCSKCHNSHSGARLRGADCASCHAAKTRAQHGRIAGGCTSCHRAHGPQGRASPPECVSCHKRGRLPGLHAVNEHGRCETCHGGHGLKPLDRNTCLSQCHPSQINHEPVAKTCVGCHPFGGSRR